MRSVTFSTENEWLRWRQTGIGGSDAPIIAGVSRFKRPFELYLEKSGQRKPPAPTQAMLHGRSLEAKARDAYTLETGNFMPPANVESEEIDWLHASLDGLDVEARLIVEVKCPFDIGPYLTCREGQVPEEYFPQLQHSLAVSGASMAHLWCYFEGQGVLLPVDFDPAYWHDELLPLERQFWDHVKRKNFPMPKGKVERSDTAWLELEDQVYQAMAMKQQAEERLRNAQSKLERLATAEVTRGHLLEATWRYYKGGIVPSYNRSPSLTLYFRRVK